MVLTGEAHERRIHVEHDVCGGDLHCMDARAKVDGKHDFNDGGGEDADDARGLDECRYTPLIWVMMATTAVTIKPRVMCVYALLTELRSACS